MLVQHFLGASWRPCFSLLEVLTVVDENGETQLGETAIVVFEIDKNGLLTAYVEKVSGLPAPRPFWRRRWRLLLGLLFVAFLVVGSLLAQYHQQVVWRKDFQKRLEHFMETHNPAKFSEIPQWMETYNGKEDLLVRRLEKKYKTRFPQQLHAGHTDL
eukprot:TRINITY_DN36879_c0_g1_i1.p1 TRINITY_DN36879_c0_g1~~TRINITY_DN36879_c0_g1_i1.p1  ORF type:complete len:157 (+),score=29.67 TRINITY_DN36879_c0_g1_i1:110-580(+)